MTYILALLRLAHIYADFGWKESARRAFEEAEALISEYRPTFPELVMQTLDQERTRVERWVYLPNVA